MSNTGYETFLKNQAARRMRAKRFIAEGLARELLGDELANDGDVLEETLLHAANHVLIVLESDGWDLMFNEEGRFKGVVV